MSATEIIDQIKTLQPEERAKVLASLLEIESAQDKRRMEDDKFQKAANQVLTHHADLLRKLAQ
ncbi:MAG TPA: hypothetical protein VE641_15730 [Chthoniobacterales bacterium]|nr:hypothetical protein [Chthoniobacterales bacterium]